MSKKRPEGIHDYQHAAGGWGALKQVALTLKRQQDIVHGTQALLKSNQPYGFDCPGCAWPDPKHTSSFEFCENGAKAVTWEATGRKVGPEFFAGHTVSSLWEQSDHWLEDQGRVTHPLRYNRATDKYEEVSWETAFAEIGGGLNTLASPDEAEFYTSGRASNEAAFLYQLFVRQYGTNNFPDCSNMCHEATSVGLPKSIGIGKATVTIEDFDHAELIISMGHNLQLTNSAAMRVWKTPNGKANFLTFPGLEEDPMTDDPEVLRLTTVRAHDQYNTTIYGLNDRYRGVFGRRDVLFISPVDLDRLGFKEGDVVDVETALDHARADRVVQGLMLVSYDLPEGCCALYYPEAQPLMALEAFDPQSLTPSYKSVPIRIRRAGAAPISDRAVTRGGIVGRASPARP